MLVDAAGPEGFRDLLRTAKDSSDGLRLLNRNGGWHTPSQLCVGSDSVSPDYRLDEEQKQLLAPLLPQASAAASTNSAAHRNGPAAPPGPELACRLGESVVRLRNYFQRWEDVRPSLRPAIGGFLAALGDGPSDEKHPHGQLFALAESYHRPMHSVEATRERMRAVSLLERPPRFEDRHVLVDVLDSPTVEEIDLCGVRLPDVPLLDTVDNLLLPFGDSVFWGVRNGEHIISRVRLR
jgi:hypothetical protein